MTTEDLKTVLEDYEKANKSKEDVVGGKELDAKGLEIIEVNGGETSCTGTSRDELEEYASVDSIVSADEDEEKEEIEDELSE